MQPNYIKIINWFWREIPHTEGYRPLYGLLFLAIVDGINRNDWRPNTPMDYERIVNKCKFTKEVYLSGRMWLMNNGFIEFTPGKNNMQIACFSLGPAVGNPTGIPTGIPTGVDSNQRSEILPVSLPIINKPQTNKTVNLKPNKIDLNIPFSEFWNLYDKKVGNKKAEILWIKLSNDERSIAMEHITQYKLSQPDKQFRKDPATYLNNKSFNDEIIIQHGKQNGSSNSKSINSKQTGVINSLDRLPKQFAQLER